MYKVEQEKNYRSLKNTLSLIKNKINLLSNSYYSLKKEIEDTLKVNDEPLDESVLIFLNKDNSNLISDINYIINKY